MSSLAYKLPENARVVSGDSMPLVTSRALQSRQRTGSMLHRETEAISPFAIVGFLVACAMVILVLFSHIELDRINSENSQLSATLTTLNAEHEDLTAQYQQLFDMDSIKSDLTASGAMIQITSEQQIFMDLSQPDSSSVYERDEETSVTPLGLFISSAQELFFQSHR